MTTVARLMVVVAVLVAIVLCLNSSESRTGSAAGPFIRRGVVVGLAADSAPGPQPSPTAVPPPLHPELVVRIEMEMYEAALVEGGTTVVELRTTLEGPEPLGASQTYLAGVVVTPHPTDVCSWEAVFMATAFEATAVRHTSLFPPKSEVTLNIKTDPSWHYDITCPTSPPTHVRLPKAPVERSLSGLA